MKVYLAGTSVSTPVEEKKIQELFQKGSKLHSYYHIPIFEKNWWEMNKKNKVNLFLDSGAFSAWTQGIEIDINEYIQFIKDHEDILTVYANLDVIGLGGKQPNELTAKMTLKNQKIMESAGLHPIPVFHFGEPMRYLQYYIEKYEYMALGVAGNKGSVLIPWLDNLWQNYLIDANGFPKIKVHGFAITSIPLMLRYPWYSVDSTSWVVTGRLGSIYIPRFKNNQWVYDERSWKISVSSQSPNLKESGQHFTTLSKQEQQIVLNYLNEKGYKIGVSTFRMESQSYQLQENERWAQKKPKDITHPRRVEVIVEPGVSNIYQLRDELNIQYFLDFEKTIPPYPRKFQIQNKIRTLL